MTMKCPICERTFNAAYTAEHIGKFHADCDDKDLVILRDARREFLKSLEPKINGKSIQPKKKHYFWSKNDMISGAPPMRGGLPSLGKKN